MRVLPVIDLLDGIVVRGIAGRRAEYRPIQSALCESPAARDVARAFRERLGLSTLYLADLDAILHERPNSELYRQLTGDGCILLIDAGVREMSRVRSVLEAGAAAAVLGLETLPEPELLQHAVAEFGSDRIIFSLDLLSGQPLQQPGVWDSADPFDIAAQAVAYGVRRLIVLDLAAVGVSGGVSTIALCRGLRKAFPDLRLITGGGVRGPADLLELIPLGLDGVLVASALHDGRWNPGDDMDIVRVPALKIGHAARSRSSP
jgi:phosphoribosylformimino-5-aminoimidazole carboxamide ribotide isomerase